MLSLTGCSTVVNTPADASGYAAMTCNELNERLGEVATEISRTAITRGKVTQTNIPGWVPGGRRVASRVIDRQTAQIESLQQRERAIASARDRSCAR